MGFIKAALSAGISSFQDSKFKEAITLPEAVPATALAIKGQLLTKDPDGRSRQSNQNTGLLTDGSVVIVPQGYVALLVNNGTFLGDLLEAGSHEWQAGENAWLFEKGGVKGTWDQFKNRFSFGGQVVTQQEIIFVRMQPFTGNKFGTQNPVEYFSDRYQQLLSIRFYGLYDVKVADPVLFYISTVSRQITADKPFTLEDVAQGTLRQNLAPKIAVAISKYTAENKADIYNINADQDVFNEVAKREVNKTWTELYGIELTNVLIEDLSYDAHPNAQFVLKLPHRRGNPRLGQEQLLGRLVDGAAFGDLHDVLKLLKRHRKPPLPLSISLFYYRHFELVVKSLSKKLSTHPAKRILTALRPLCYSISRTKQNISVI